MTAKFDVANQLDIHYDVLEMTLTYMTYKCGSCFAENSTFKIHVHIHFDYNYIMTWCRFA